MTQPEVTILVQCEADGAAVVADVLSRPLYFDDIMAATRAAEGLAASLAECGRRVELHLQHGAVRAKLVCSPPLQRNRPHMADQLLKSPPGTAMGGDRDAGPDD